VLVDLLLRLELGAAHGTTEFAAVLLPSVLVDFGRFFERPDPELA
jgi:hypothetical protein